MRMDALAPKVSALLMLVLFCGTFFYHTALGIGLIPPYLGGYVTIASAAVSIPMFAFMANSLVRTGKLKIIDLLFFLFILGFSLISVYHYLIGEHLENVRDHALQITNMIACYLIFRCIDISDRSMKKLIIASTIAMSAVIVALSSGGRFYLKDSAPNPEIVANYQTFAIAYLCPLIVAISKIEKFKFRAILFTIGCICLYMNSSRSEFVQLIIFYIAFETCRSKYRIVSPIITASLGAIAIAGLIALDSGASGNRISNLLNLSEDKSSTVRNELTESGLDKILDSPFVGDYGNYEKGHYIHNILSAWQDLGILGFILYLVMFIIPITHLIICTIIKQDRSRDFAAALSIMSSTLILLIFAKFFTYQLVGVSLGVYTSVIANRSAHAKLMINAKQTSMHN